MRKFTAKELEEFLIAIESLLIRETEIIIIGGTAAALAYKVSLSTQDIDTWNSIKGLEDAYKKAIKKTKLEIPMNQTSVADAPHNFENRLIQYKLNKFKKLKVYIPNVVDLILMKMLRGYEHDLNAIEEMVKNENVKANELVKIFKQELGSVIGDKRKIDLNFLAVIQRCYGKELSQKIQLEIGFK